MNSKILVRILINTLIGAALIYFWLKLVDIKAIGQTLSKVNFSLLPLVIITFLIASLLRAQRLKILLSEFKIPSLTLSYVTMIGQLLSYTIPIRAGELTKGIYLSTHYNLPFGKSLVWILLDRFVDFWFTLVLALLLIIFIPTGFPDNFKPVLILAVAVVSIGTFFLLFAPKLIKKILTFLSHLLILSSLKKLFHKLVDFLLESALFLKKGPKDSSLVIGITITALILDALAWYIGFLAVSGQGFNLLSIQLGSVLSSLTYLIPAAPGYVGSAEASGLAVFTYGLGFDKTLVSATTVLIHALTLIYILGAGLISLYLLKFDLNLVWKKFKK